MHRRNIFHVWTIVAYFQRRLDKLLLQVPALRLFQREDVFEEFSTSVLADCRRAKFRSHFSQCFIFLTPDLVVWQKRSRLHEEWPESFDARSVNFCSFAQAETRVRIQFLVTGEPRGP